MTDVKYKIICAAAERMNKIGIRSLSIDDISHLLGISKKTFYVHFATKEDLVEAVLAHNADRILERTQYTIQNDSIETMLRSCLRIVYQTKQIVQPPAFVFDLKKYYPKRFEAYKAIVFERTIDFIVSFLEKGKAEGYFRQDLEVKETAHFLARLHQGVFNTLTDDKNFDEQILIQDTMHGLGIILRGIVSEEGGEKVRALFDEIAKASAGEKSGIKDDRFPILPN